MRLSVHVFFIGGIDVVFTHLTICEVKIEQFAIMSCSEKLKITLLCLCTRQCFVFGEKNFSKRKVKLLKRLSKCGELSLYLLKQLDAKYQRNN